MSLKVIATIVVEILITSICPLPGTGTISYGSVRASGNVINTPNIPLDTFLSIPMFCRLYLLFRGYVLHTKVYNDMQTRAIAALNNITHFTNGFILKWTFTYNPTTTLFWALVVYFLSAAYILRLVER